MSRNYINLHLFDLTVVNGTNGYTNAATGDVENFSGSNTLSPTMKTYYDTELLENARGELYYAQFGRKQPLPQGRGKKVEWRRWNTIPKAMVSLEEGFTPTGQKLGQTTVEAAITQHGDYVAYTDQLKLHAIDDVILGATEELGAAAGATQDTLTRNELMTGTNVLYAPAVKDGVIVSRPRSRYELTVDCKFTPTVVNQLVTILKKNKAPKIDGKYVAILHPSVTYDLRESEGWIEAHKYAATTEIFNGEIGELHNVRFCESTEAPVYVGEPLNGIESRYLSVAAYSAAGGGTAEKGVATSYKITVSENISLDLVGREILIEDTSNNATLEHAVIVGVNATDKAIFLAEAPTTEPAQGDFLNPGEGGAENHTNNEAVAVYPVLALGKEAYGMIDPDGAGMEMILKPLGSGGTNDPLNQRGTIGYKFSSATAILYQERMLRVECCSAYSADDDAQ